MGKREQNKIRCGLIFGLLLFSFGLFSQTKIDSLGLNNLYQVDNGVYRSELPDKQSFENLYEYGITEVINLRYYHSDKKQADTTKLILYQVPMKANKIKNSDVIQVLRIINNRKGNILIHCKHGADRTGVIVAMYRIVFQDWTKEQAIEEMTMERYGFHQIYTNIIEYINNVDVEYIKKWIW